MKEKFEEGLVWHMFHNTLLSYCWDYERRIEIIKFDKPSNEVPMRLERFQPVKGELPEDFAHVTGWANVEHLVKIHKEVIEKLHEQECLGCSWNGRELVFPGESYVKRIIRWLGSIMRWRE